MRIKAHLKRHLIIAGAIVLPLLVGAASPSLVERVRTVTVSATTPLLELQGRAIQFLGDQAEAILQLRGLKHRNAELESELKSLKAALVEFEELKREKARLASLLRLNKDLQYTTMASRVIARDPSHWSQYIVIDKGTTDHVRENTVLVHPDGLVGKVIASGPHSSRSILLIDRESRVSAINQRTRDVGLIEGTGTMLLKMTYLDREAKIEVGDTIISSGLGGIYPKGILIGKVHMIGEDDHQLTIYAIVKPSAPFSKLEELSCVFTRTKD